jgi:hypothetical protein
VIGEPIVRQIVVDVVWIEQRDQQVDVEQGDLAHVSSRSAFTWRSDAPRPVPWRPAARRRRTRPKEIVLPGHAASGLCTQSSTMLPSSAHSGTVFASAGAGAADA